MNKVPYGTRIGSRVPDVDGIKKLILGEAHDTAYSIHPGKYKDVRWYGMKRAVGENMSQRCDTCRRVKAEHRDLRRIISDRGSRFTSRLRERLHDSLDSKLRFGTAYHPRTDGRTERTNQILEDMLRACAIQYGTGWDKSPPYAEFSYNNGYQAGPKKSPFEAPYGEGAGHRYFGIKQREARCSDPTLSRMLNKQIKMVRENLRVARSGREELCGFATKPIGIHNEFHVSQLKKCLRVPEEQAPPEGPDVQEDLTYTEHPVKILETSERVTRNRRVKMCRVQWKHHTEDEATWEREEELRATYPGLFANHL
ncbi:hypothetical protein U9M48_034480 [Paspalum notatum var. saurae]|uniref:Uncharacterized protein n=1 Tax=Paspalum notatum var. saurae TaxID=547442 RepID=A0AAQ3UCZ4_PASNO